ncbi:Map microtubule affinity-regulating kinase [Phlyctochytrium planicorne]|nr:Map microtubule affinity-regulating kinase [Phlyctochytrium planicorne]
MIEKKILGNYNVGKTIGQGAFSKVKLGVHKETGQKVAIKIIDKKQMAIKAAKAKKANEERERRKRAEREAQQGKQQHHQQQQQQQQQPQSGAGTQDGNAQAAATPTPTPGSEDAAKKPADDSTSKPADRNSTPSFVSSLQLEVQLLMRLDHPNVITLYQVMETEDECFVVMEFASGGELIEYIAAKNHLNEKEARRFFRQLISAMDHCHLANVVHRDLKLENLLLTDNKTLLISDFGLGRTFQNDSDELMKTFCGTPNYAAVELISGIPYIGVKSDIWAMGVVLYVMMTGKPPFTGENISALYSKIKAVDYTCPDYFSPELKALFAKILKKDPKARIDMDGLRNDPWVNMDETEPPQRIIPKIVGPPTSAQVGQCIASITRDSECIIYTIRSHMRDGKSISGAPDKKVMQRRQSSAPAPGMGGGRRRSSSFAPAPNAQDLRIPSANSASRSISPTSRTASIKEDGEDGVGELPSRILDASGSLPRPSRSGSRRLSLMEGSKPSPLSMEASNRQPLNAQSLPRPSATSPPSMAPDHPGGPEMGRQSQTMPRKRRNTITLLFGGKEEAPSPTHARSSTEEPTRTSPVQSVETSSTAIAARSPTDGGFSASLTFGRSAARARRATIVAGDDRSLNVARRMSMVVGNPADTPRAPSPSISVSPAGQSPNGTSPSSTHATVAESGNTLSRAATIIDKVIEADEDDGVVPSKQEIEDWHMMHRPAREIRAVRYNFSSKTTSSLNPAAIFQEVHRVLLLVQRLYDNRISFNRVEDYYMFHCKLSEPNPDHNVEFEIEVCKIWLLKVHGIRMKRLTGSAFVFKDLYTSIVDELNI